MENIGVLVVIGAIVVSLIILFIVLEIYVDYLEHKNEINARFKKRTKDQYEKAKNFISKNTK